MKKILLITMLAGLISCKSEMEKVRDYDMSKYCKDFYVLIEPGNELFYILVNKENPKVRFTIYKNMNKDGSGYGFCYGLSDQFDDLMKNGMQATAGDAVEKGQNRAKNGTNVWMGYLMRFDGGSWIGYAGLRLKELCPEK